MGSFPDRLTFEMRLNEVRVSHPHSHPRDKHSSEREQSTPGPEEQQGDQVLEPSERGKEPGTIRSEEAAGSQGHTSTLQTL